METLLLSGHFYYLNTRLMGFSMLLKQITFRDDGKPHPDFGLVNLKLRIAALATVGVLLQISLLFTRDCLNVRPFVSNSANWFIRRNSFVLAIANLRSRVITDIVLLFFAYSLLVTGELSV